MPRITEFSGKVLAGKTLKRVLAPVIPTGPTFGPVATNFIDTFSGDKKYIDITNGSDSNNGDTDATAYQTLSYAQSQTASIGTAVMYVIKPGVYDLTPVLIPAVTGSHSSVGLSDDGLPRTFFCAAGQVTLQWVSEGRDCPMVSFENTNSAVYGAILKRDNNGKTLSYAIPMFNATTAWSKGDFYNCVFQETNANGNWSLMQDAGASGGANTLGTIETIVNNCSFYTTENAQDDYTTSTGLVLNNSAFSHIWGTNSNSIRNNTISAQTMDATTYELAANNSTNGVYSGTYAWGDDMWIEPAPSGLVATGGTVTEITEGGVDYKVHTFTSSGTFEVVSGAADVEYLVVGGGGGGGGTYHAGGGGAGGVLTGSTTVTPESYTVSVGAGGAGGIGSLSSDIASVGSNGVNSLAFGFVAIGGGGGGSYNSFQAGSGGSGGGEPGNGNNAGLSTLSKFGLGTSGQGNPGGKTAGTTWCGGGGGGGAGAVGANGSSNSSNNLGCFGGDGGIGVGSSINGTATYYGGGGGGAGGASSGFGPGGAGGLGGGGRGSDAAGEDGQANTGGGGGGSERGYGGTGGATAYNGGAGGSGIVIIRYPAGVVEEPVAGFGPVATNFIDTFSGDKKYIDITNGSDGNNGDTDAAAYQTLGYAQAQTAAIGTAVMYVIKPGVYDLTPTIISANFSSVGISDGNLPRTFFCAAGQVILQWTANSAERDAGMTSLQNANSAMYGAILKRNNNGKSLNYSVGMINGETAQPSNGDFYNCVFQETNANGNWALQYDNGGDGVTSILNNCSFYTTENGANDYAGGAGLVLNNNAFRYAPGTTGATLTNAVTVQTMNATTYELSANNNTHGVHSGTYSWGESMWMTEPLPDPIYIQEGTLIQPTIVGPLSETFAISGDGNTAVYTNSYQTTTADYAGKAWFLARTGSSWVIQASYEGTNSLAGDRDNYGYSCAISDDGNTIVVGSQRQRENPANAGAIYVYSRNGTSWSQTQYLQASDKQDGDQFGKSLSLSGDGNTLIAAAPYEDAAGADAGAVYVYQRAANGTGFGNQIKLLASSIGQQEAGALYGQYVKISNDASTLAIGATADDATAGAIYIYTRNRAADGSFSWPHTYNFQAKISDATDPYVYFGGGLQLSGDGNTLISRDFTSTALNLFTRSDATWTQQADITSPDGNIFTYNSMSNSGDRIVSGNNIAVGDGNTGIVRSFTKTGETWAQDPVPILPDVSSYTKFSSVYLSGDALTLIVRSSVGNFMYDSPGPTEAYYLTTGTAIINGESILGSTLTASNNLADGDGISAISYQWNRDGVAITGATATTYTLVEADLGAVITVTANYTEGGGTSGSVTSLGTDAITTGNYTHPTYGTLVATFNSPDWQPVGGVSVTEGNPLPSDSTNVILSDSAFQAVRAATTANRVWYVWGDNLENYASVARSTIEGANVKPAPTTTINPNNFGFFTSFRVHWWSETSGATLTGSDYSFVAYRDTNNLSLYEYGPTKFSSKNVVMNTNHTTSKFYIFYQ